MKNTILLLFALQSILFSQSPYYSLKLSVEEWPLTRSTKYNYNITAQICEFDYTPEIPSGDYWFGNDTSKLNWNNLPDSMYKLLSCGKNFQSGGLKLESSNQSMMWEKIFRIDIARTDFSDSGADTMTIVFPVLIKSFVTYINISGIDFQPGYYELIGEFSYDIDKNKHVHIKLPEPFTWKSINFEERKIRLNK